MGANRIASRSGKEAVGDQRMDVRMEIEVFAKGVEREDDARDPLRTIQGRAQVFCQALLRQSAEALKKVAMALEVGPEHSGNSQNIMPVGHRGQHVVQDEAGGGLDVFLVTRRTEPAAFAGKGQQVFVLAMVAADPGEPAFQVAAIEKFVNHLGDDGAQPAVTRLVSIRIDLLKLVIVPVGALPERRLFWVAGAIGLHV